MVVATWAQLDTFEENVTSYWPVPMWVTPVTPLPATSVPDRLTLAYRLELAASAGAALARPMIAGAAKVAATPPVVSAIRLRRRALVPVNMKCLPYEMRRRMCRPGAGGWRRRRHVKTGGPGRPAHRQSYVCAPAGIDHGPGRPVRCPDPGWAAGARLPPPPRRRQPDGLPVLAGYGRLTGPLALITWWKATGGLFCTHLP